MRRMFCVLAALCALLAVPAVADDPPPFDVAGDRSLDVLGPIPVQGELVDYGGFAFSAPDLTHTYWRFGQLWLTPDSAMVRWILQTDRSGYRNVSELNEPILLMPWSDDFGAYIALVPRAGAAGIWNALVLDVEFEHEDGPRAHLWTGVLRTLPHHPWYGWSPDWPWQQELIVEQFMEVRARAGPRKVPQ